MHFNIILPAPPAASAVMIAGLNPAYDNRISFIATGTPPPPQCGDRRAVAYGATSHCTVN
jgi:hypothetical protein